MNVEPSRLDPAMVGRLDRAAAEHLLVRVHSWIPDVDAVRGFVVGRGTGWLLLASVSETIHLDGWRALRIADVRAVEVVPDRESLPARALRARGEWPPVAPPLPLDLSDDASVIVSASRNARLLAVHRERLDPETCWIGVAGAVGDDSLELLELDSTAEWRRHPTTVEFADITCIDIGGGYEDALELVADPVPDLG